MEDQDLKIIIADNITKFRKINNLTQAELAEKLNYSDKAVSKWERAEALPDVTILYKIAKLFDITLNDLVTKTPERKLKSLYMLLKKKRLIPVLSGGLVWLIATIVFTFLKVFNAPTDKAWYAFVIAVPVTFIVLLTFSAMWGNTLSNCILTSLLTWSIALVLFLTIPTEGAAWIFLIPIPLQILIVLWFIMRKKPKKHIL